MALPVGQLLLSSFFKFFGFYEADMLTFEHYRNVWENSGFWRAFGNTMLLGVVGATATMALGGIVAYVTTRTRWRGRRLIDVLAWLPWMMPGMVLGIGFLWGFAILPHAIPIYGTLWALLLAYIALGTPVAVRVTSAAYQQIATDIEECSRVHGAGWWQTLGRILIALAWPAFAVGWVLIFFGIMRELSASILLYAPGTEVLSVVMLKMWVSGKPEEVSVIGLVMLVLVLVFRWVQLELHQEAHQHALKRIGKGWDHVEEKRSWHAGGERRAGRPRRGAERRLGEGGRGRQEGRQARHLHRLDRLALPQDGHQGLRAEVRHPGRAAGGARQRGPRAGARRTVGRPLPGRHPSQRQHDDLADDARRQLPAARRRSRTSRTSCRPTRPTTSASRPRSSATA